jgi:tetratricopeptide (TPR) repeat protein
MTSPELRTGLVLMMIFWFISSGLAAQGTPIDDPALLFQKAHEAYAEGDFLQAEEFYHSVIDLGERSADVYYNLGNSYFRQNQFALAILSYERALRLRPGDESIRYNLMLANSFVKDEITPLKPFFVTEWWRITASFLPPFVWLIIHVLLFTVFLLAAGRFLISRNEGSRIITFRSALSTLALSLLFLALALQSHHSVYGKTEAIILNETAAIKSGPGLLNNTLGQYHSGTKVRVTNQEGGWYEVKSADGHIGWIAGEDLEII